MITKVDQVVNNSSSCDVGIFLTYFTFYADSKSGGSSAYGSD